MKLHPEVRTELEWLLDIEAEVECETQEEKIASALFREALTMILEGHGELTDAHREILKGELSNHATKDVIAEDPAMRKRWNAVMARFGFLDVFSPDEVEQNRGNPMYRKPKTCKVDGIVYEAAI